MERKLNGGEAAGGAIARRGVIYVATGDTYRRDAELSAASLKKIHPGLPVCLFSDKPSASPHFDRFVEVRNPHRRSKLDCMVLSPFAETLFLDSDTRVVAPVDDAFRLLERFDLAMAHVKMRHPEGQERQGYPAGEVPASFHPLNSGVMYYRLTPRVAGFLETWAAEFQRVNPKLDQIVLRDLLWRHPEISVYTLPWEYNAREIPNIMYNEARMQQIKVLHLPFFNTKWGLRPRLQKTLRKVPLPGRALVNLWRMFRAF